MNCELDTAEASIQLYNLLSASLIGQMIEAVRQGMHFLNLKRRGMGSVTKDNKFKSLSECWFTKKREKKWN